VDYTGGAARTGLLVGDAKLFNADDERFRHFFGPYYGVVKAL
jgi:hypothetical protein